jgi:hypothetical protein
MARHRVQTAMFRTATGLGEPSYGMNNDVAPSDAWWVLEQRISAVERAVTGPEA